MLIKDKLIFLFALTTLISCQHTKKKKNQNTISNFLFSKSLFPFQKLHYTSNSFDSCSILNFSQSLKSLHFLASPHLSLLIPLTSSTPKASKTLHPFLPYPIPLSVKEYSFNLTEKSSSNFFITNIKNIAIKNAYPPLTQQQTNKLNFKIHKSEFHSKSDFSQEPKEDFSLGLTTGVLSSKKSFDRDKICHKLSSCSVSFLVQITPVEYYQKIKIKVNLIDINDHTPQFPSNQSYINISSDQEIIDFPLAMDEDSDNNGLIKYYIDKKNNKNFLNYFEIYNNKQLKVVEKLISPPFPKSFTLQIIAQDGGLEKKSSSIFLFFNVTFIVTSSSTAFIITTTTTKIIKTTTTITTFIITITTITYTTNTVKIINNINNTSIKIGTKNSSINLNKSKTPSKELSTSTNNITMTTKVTIFNVQNIKQISGPNNNTLIITYVVCSTFVIIVILIVVAIVVVCCRISSNKLKQQTIVAKTTNSCSSISGIPLTYDTSDLSSFSDFKNLQRTASPSSTVFDTRKKNNNFNDNKTNNNNNNDIKRNITMSSNEINLALKNNNINKIDFTANNNKIINKNNNNNYENRINNYNNNEICHKHIESAVSSDNTVNAELNKKSFNNSKQIFKIKKKEEETDLESESGISYNDSGFYGLFKNNNNINNNNNNKTSNYIHNYNLSSTSDNFMNNNNNNMNKNKRKGIKVGTAIQSIINYPFVDINKNNNDNNINNYTNNSSPKKQKVSFSPKCDMFENYYTNNNNNDSDKKYNDNKSAFKIVKSNSLGNTLRKNKQSQPLNHQIKSQCQKVMFQQLNIKSFSSTSNPLYSSSLSSSSSSSPYSYFNKEQNKCIQQFDTYV